MRYRTAFLLAIGAIAAAGPARAADTSTLGAIEAYPTLTSIGVYADVAGDDDGDANVWVEVRASGEASFTKGHALMRISTGRFAGSIFFLTPGKSYDVRVVLADPDNSGTLTADANAVMRANEPVAAPGATIWVDAASGNDSNDGSAGAPLATIQAGADKAQPGATVHVKSGVYREQITPPSGGDAAHPIWFLADSGAVIDGSDPALEKPTWTNEGGDLYSTPFAGQTQYIAADDARLYDYASLTDLQGGVAGLPGGFFVGNGKLYVRMPDGSDPSAATFHVAIRNTGFLLDTIGHVVVDGFELRYLGGSASGVAVDVRDTHHAWIRNNHAHHMNAGYRVRRELASENVIENNTFRDTSIWNWPWDASKAHTPEASAISIQNGRGNVVRFNQVEGSFNGIDAGEFNTTDENIAKDTDVYGNVMRQHADDGVEPEGACVNVRFWHNVIFGVHNAISLAPIVVGPTWAVRNLVVDFKAHVLKLNNGSTGWILVYHTTGVPMAGMIDAQALEPTEPFGPFVSRNNIYEAHRYVVENGLSSVNAGVSLDYDDLFTDDTTRFVKWLNVKYMSIAELSAAGLEQNGFQEKPAYDDPSQNDYELVLGHPLIDKGVVIDGINSGFVVGAGPDVGAFERDGVSPFDDASPTGGSAGTAGSATGGASGSATGGSAGMSGNGANPGTGGSAANSGNDTGSEDEGGCGCRLAAGNRHAALWLLAIGLLAVRRRQRR